MGETLKMIETNTRICNMFLISSGEFGLIKIKPWASFAGAYFAFLGRETVMESYYSYSYYSYGPN